MERLGLEGRGERSIDERENWRERLAGMEGCPRPQACCAGRLASAAHLAPHLPGVPYNQHPQSKGKDLWPGRCVSKDLSLPGSPRAF